MLEYLRKLLIATAKEMEDIFKKYDLIEEEMKCNRDRTACYLFLKRGIKFKINVHKDTMFIFTRIRRITFILEKALERIERQEKLEKLEKQEEDYEEIKEEQEENEERYPVEIYIKDFVELFKDRPHKLKELIKDLKELERKIDGINTYDYLVIGNRLVSFDEFLNYLNENKEELISFMFDYFKVRFPQGDDLKTTNIYYKKKEKNKVMEANND